MKIKNITILTMALLIATMLVGCSSSAEPVKETKEAETTSVKDESHKETVTKVASPTPDSTPEPTPVATNESGVNEKVDMDSTLPGIEWMSTFEGIIKEPKFVVFNDQTNKKIIAEEEQKIKFEPGDILCIYKPDNAGISYYHAAGVVTTTISHTNSCFELVCEGVEEETCIQAGIVSSEYETLTISIILIP